MLCVSLQLLDSIISVIDVLQDNNVFHIINMCFNICVNILSKIIML